MSDIPRPHEEFTRLSDLRKGEQAVIQGYEHEDSNSRKTREMGFNEDIAVKITQKHSGKLIVSFSGSRIGLSQKLADNILVKRQSPRP